MTKIGKFFRACRKFQRSHWFHEHISKFEYRFLLAAMGVLLFLAHFHAPEHEIDVVLLIHTLVTLDPTV